MTIDVKYVEKLEKQNQSLFNVIEDKNQKIHLLEIDSIKDSVKITCLLKLISASVANGIISELNDLELIIKDYLPNFSMSFFEEENNVFDKFLKILDDTVNQYPEDVFEPLSDYDREQIKISVGKAFTK